MNRPLPTISLSRTPKLFAAAMALAHTIGTLSSVQADNSFFWYEEVGGNVIFHHQSSIDLTGFPAPTGGGTNSMIFPSAGAFIFGGGFHSYSPVIPDTTTMPFGSSGAATSDSSTGDNFGLSQTNLAVPANYVSQTPFSGSMTFLSETISSLGVNTTPYTIKTTIGDNTIYMFTSPAEFAADLAKLRKKIRKLQKKAKKLKTQGKASKARKLKKKVRKLKKELAALS